MNSTNDSTNRLAHMGLSVRLLLAALTLVLLRPTGAAAAPGDFKNTDWAAAAPYTYDHNTGGGAYDDRTVGDTKDITEQLEGGQFACGDIVTYLAQFEMEDVTVDARQAIRFEVRLLADSTGQTGAAHMEITKVAVNYGPVQGGDGPGGTDSAIMDDGGSTATLIDQYFDPASGPFTAGTDLVGIIELTDLEAGEVVVVRVDAKLGCKVYTNPTGNLQGSLGDIEIVDPVNGGSPTSGNQTIPFLKIGEIVGTGAPAPRILKSVTTEAGACPGQEQIDAVIGDAVKYCYEIFNDGTDDLFNVSVIDDAGTPGDASDDFEILFSGLVDADGDGEADDLLAGQSVLGSALVELSGQDGQALTNVAVLAGDDGTAKANPYSASDSATALLSAPPVPPASIALDVTVSLSPDCASSGDPITAPEGAFVYYCYTVTNDGGQTVSGISIDDTGATAGGSLDLAPGETGLLVSDPVLVSGDLSSSATAAGSDELGGAVEASDGASVDAVASALLISVTASLDGVCGNEDDADLQTVLEGTTVVYCYAVTNAGETVLSGVSISDPDAVVFGSADLLPGETYIFSSEPAAIVVDEEHLAFAEAVDSFGLPVSSELDAAGVDVVHPSLSISKTISLDGSCPGSEEVQVLAGTAITYCYEIVNDGDTDLSGILVSDGDLSLDAGDLAVGGSLLISAEAFGVGEADLYSEAAAAATDVATGTAVDSGPDGALVDVVHPSLSISTTVSLDGTCPGVEVVNVLADTAVTWCYEIENTGDVAVNSIQVNDDLFGTLDEGIAILLPGESVSLSMDDAIADDVTLTASASGLDAAVGSLVLSGDDAAAVNVVHPGLTIDVTVSLDGTCPGVDAAQVIAGESVIYCYAISNTGDTSLYDVEILDDLLGSLGIIEFLDAGASYSFSSDWITVEDDQTATVYAAGTDEFGFPVSDGDVAVIEAIKADLVLDKQAPEKLITSEGSSLTYTLTVSNVGEAVAYAAVVSDELPAGVSFVSASAGCVFDGFGTITCALGDLAPGASAVISIETFVEVSLAKLVNTAFVISETPDENIADNQDSAETLVAPGATRTIGFYSTHPDFVALCLDVNGGEIDLGFVRLADETFEDEIDVDADGDLESGLELALGILNANIMRYTDKSKRSKLDKARMQAGRQVLAAWCNETLLGGTSDIDFDGAFDALAGDDVKAILKVSAQADTFNNSGDAVDLGVNPGPASANHPWDDPTDFND
jgi:uncharacterized repeat protein (TIGR01451 family)